MYRWICAAALMHFDLLLFYADEQWVHGPLAHYVTHQWLFVWEVEIDFMHDLAQL